ncbi:Hypothetical predicted protein [Lecanosticta acicola]|uniref:Uncharacterized protein n=1 Tax=Lecanosticta acicola TaxID=111012 RepID=A0AAI9EBR0_9PEZI|nr:Hypothetical predicted protein [Lecanosticta acicola]
MADRTEQSVPPIQDIAAIPLPSSPPAMEEHLGHVTFPPDLFPLGDVRSEPQVKVSSAFEAEQHVKTHIDGELPVDTAPATPSGLRKELKVATVSIFCTSMSAFWNWNFDFVNVAWVWLVMAVMILFLPAEQGEEVFDCGVLLGGKLAMAIVRFCEAALGRLFARVLDQDEEEDEQEDEGTDGEDREDFDDERQ